MLTEEEISLLTKRRDAAISALRFFKEIKNIKSSNTPFASLTEEENINLTRIQQDTPAFIADKFDAVATYGLGNCGEKAQICYASLISNPVIKDNSHVTLSQTMGFDHAFVIVSDEKFYGSPLKWLGKTVMVVDGWTEDWYFPNLGWTDMKHSSLWHVPNPHQAYARSRLHLHSIYSFTAMGNMPGLVRE